MSKGVPEESAIPARPAPYSTTDAAESDAVTTLRSLLDSRRVSHDLRERDKHPNIDGYIELVDEGGHPLGKIEVQIRKLVSDATSCPCPTSLVAYSKATTLPVIFVGVDALNARAYWTHISELTPGYKRNQQSFTVRFADSFDSIDKATSCPCYHRWLELTREYQRRISRYPLLDARVSSGDTLASLTPQHREALQRYVDTVNHLLDNDFKTIKKLLFPTIWKFGVGCRLLGAETVLYQISAIPLGQPDPLVVGLPEDVTLKMLGPNVQTAGTQDQKEFFASPELNGQQFVFRLVRGLWRAKEFPVHGVEMAADVVLTFLRRYSRWLDIDPNIDEYRVEDLRGAFGVTLSKKAGLVADRLPAVYSSVKVVNLDTMASQLGMASTSGPANRWAPTHYVLSSVNFPIRLAFDSLALLESLSVPTITRRFRSADLGYQPPPNNYIWSCYSRQRETENVTEILKRAIDEYAIFVRGNAFHVENSPYLDQTTSIVFEYVSFYDNPAEQGPALREYHLRDPKRALEKTSVLVAGADNRLVDQARSDWSIVVNNLRFEVLSVTSMVPDFFFGDFPLTRLIYRFLADDLKRQYKETIS